MTTDLNSRPEIPIDAPSPRGGGRVWPGAASLTIHAAVLAVLALHVSRAPDLPFPVEAAVEVVFQPPVEPAPPPDQAAEAPGTPVTEPPPPASPSPEQPPPEAPSPEPPPRQQPEPVPPPPEPTPRPRPDLVPPAPVPSPKPKPSPPRPAAKTPVTGLTPAAPVPPPAASQAIDPAWRSAVSNWLAARKTYPEEARHQGEEGRVAIRFTVDRGGHVLDVALASSSGSARLDQAALAMLKGATLPPFPAAMGQAPITITTTMRYSLQ